MESN
jgi:WD40 repeat protein